ncbi:hypothetical protein [Microtetraspora malaysiensis]|uniref:DODA-type extradiol aromatic ring-opening family dioxygenase n=1 Tax=Microtetraspora malaysiensis TaxID=161358 RepID=UPI003D8DD6A0
MGRGRPGGPGRPRPPLSLTVGRWLLDRADLPGPGPAVRFEAVAIDAPPDECAALGAKIARAGDRVAVLAMGDGSARLTEKSPGYLHPAAAPYDEMLADALGNARVDRLAVLDPAEAADLWVAGRAVFQALAAAAGARDESIAAGGLRGELLYQDAPYGVGYLVARWSAADAA